MTEITETNDSAGWIDRLVANLPELVGEEEVARLLRLSQRTLARWRSQGKIRAWVRTSDAGAAGVLIPKDEVGRLLRAMAGGAEAESSGEVA